MATKKYEEISGGRLTVLYLDRAGGFTVVPLEINIHPKEYI